MVGLVLYISSINDEVLNRTESSEAYFTYKYGWSFAFAAFSFLLTEVKIFYSQAAYEFIIRMQCFLCAA